MYPTFKSNCLQEQNPNQHQHGDEESIKCLLQDKDTHKTTILPESKNSSSPLRSTIASPSHLATTHLEKSPLALHDDQQRDEEWGYGIGGEEPEGRVGGEGKKVTSPKTAMTRRVRDLAGFWLLGFCNNFTYWVMITAAYDLLAVRIQDYSERNSAADTLEQPFNASLEVNVGVPVRNNDSFINTFKCNHHSTGAILVADTLPGTALTLAAPLTMLLGVSVRVWLLSALCIASYLVLGLASPDYVFLGVALASASRGFSDSTFLGHASNFHKHVLSLWSSGTGVATFMGPLLFSAMTTIGFLPRHVLLSFLMVPLLIIFSFWCVLSRPQSLKEEKELKKVDSVALVCEEEIEGKRQKTMASIKEKIILFGRTQKYLLPLAVFYLIMYATNQGLLELVYFPGSRLSHAQQYSWSNTIRCFGTFVSRSFHKLCLLPSMWIYSFFALVIMAVVGTDAYYHYLPSEYIIFALLLVQGLSEGAVFRAAVFTIHNKTSEGDRKFCLTVFPVSLFLPAIIAGFISIPVHDFLCHNHIYRQ